MKHLFSRPRRLVLVFSLLAFQLIYVFLPQAYAQEEGLSPSYQDDFYTAVNEHWLRQTELSSGLPVVSGFSQLSQQVYSRLFSDFSQLPPDRTPGSLGQFLRYLHLAMDLEERNHLGVTPAQPFLDAILKLENLEDFSNRLPALFERGVCLPFSLQVMPDMKDASVYALYATKPKLILPDISYYTSDEADVLFLAFIQSSKALLNHFSIPDAEDIVRDAIAFDRLLLPYGQSAIARSNFVDLYHPTCFESFDQGLEHLDFKSFLSETAPGEIILTNPEYFLALPQIVTEANFPLLKHWMLVHSLFDLAPFLDEAYYEAAEKFQMAVLGQTEPSLLIDQSFALSLDLFAPVVGDYYGKSYLGAESSQAVLEIAQHLIETFQTRLDENPWLTEQTKEKAIEKLKNLQVHIGYPEKIPTVYQEFALEEEDGFFGASLAMTSLLRQENLSRYGQKVDHSIWSMPAHMVNASYSPMANTITFPAAILQAPFYAPEQSVSQNYGGIGAVIAHEITHAFDTNGANFGPDGSLDHWWTEADYEAFLARADEMQALFDGIAHGEGFVDGLLTVSENIADAGGLMCALEALMSFPEYDLEAFFESWASIWKMKATPEYSQLLLTLDVHAPAQLRTNIQLSNLDLFYDVYDIDETDGMYIEPERRVLVW